MRQPGHTTALPTKLGSLQSHWYNKCLGGFKPRKYYIQYTHPKKPACLCIQVTVMVLDVHMKGGLLQGHCNVADTLATHLTPSDVPAEEE